MIFPETMMHESVWFQQQSYEEAREHYELFLNNNLTLAVSKSHGSEGILSKDTQAAMQTTSSVSSNLISDIEETRKAIKESLSGVGATSGAGEKQIAQLQKENASMKKLIADLAEQVSQLEVRVSKLEKGSTAAAAAAGSASTKAAAAKDDDDDDFELFDDSDEEEETEAEKKRKEEIVAKYHEKKAKKAAVIAKSSILLDIKPWDDETDMKEMERLVRTIQTDGLLWGAAKLVPLAYGIKKLQINCVVEDDKVGTDFLDEEISKFEDFVQSVDVAAFNKI